MAITIGAANFSTLTAQPFGYEETDTRAGQTARKWLITGLLKPSEWLSLLDVYDAWQDARISDQPTEISGVVGTTVSFTGEGPGSQAWSSIPCWFIKAPSAEQTGAYLSVSVELVDAAQAVEVLLRANELGEVLTFGVLSFTPNGGGGAVEVTLTRPPDTFQDGPQVSISAAGSTLITGPQAAHEIKQVEGYISSGNWDDLLLWYKQAIASSPEPGDIFPIQPPTATAEAVVIGGVKSTRYNVQLTYLEAI